MGGGVQGFEVSGFVRGRVGTGRQRGGRTMVRKLVHH